MIYWSNNTIASSMNYYYEIIADVKSMSLITKEQVYVPTALADYKHESRYANGAWPHIPFKNIIQHNYITKGGHFAALEQPAAFSEDVISFGKKIYEMHNSL
eukprot:Phypoly_transcript_24749.p2 GENE.Phypoly_transcript_24749~~Phypoly_transcript_24749.p2  ORF type:complete len:102 (+),score=12.34 Phypoly_transcript_24749:185-490(+)